MTNDPGNPPIDLTKVILWLIMGIVIVVVLAIYIGVVIDAGVRSLDQPTEPAINPAVTAVTTGVAGALATNLGAFLGVSIATGTFSVDGFKDKFKAPTVQAVFALLYIIVLLIALGFWIKDGFSSDTAEIIRTQTETLFGVGIGAFAVLLNTKLK